MGNGGESSGRGNGGGVDGIAGKAIKKLDLPSPCREQKVWGDKGNF